jgi:hypothetical protein
MALLYHLRGTIEISEIPEAYVIETVYTDIVDSVLWQLAGPAHIVKISLIGGGTQ